MAGHRNRAGESKLLTRHGRGIARPAKYSASAANRGRPGGTTELSVGLIGENRGPAGALILGPVGRTRKARYRLEYNSFIEKQLL